MKSKIVEDPTLNTNKNRSGTRAHLGNAIADLADYFARPPIHVDPDDPDIPPECNFTEDFRTLCGIAERLAKEPSLSREVLVEMTNSAVKMKRKVFWYAEGLATGVDGGLARTIFAMARADEVSEALAGLKNQAFVEEIRQVNPDFMR
ncbi:MAG: hypothetical protein KGR26_01905 [Cyanobacteria bacterium REEB65]|nr:hypothetical protein [Cyanobacteria bacterium REEB65]